ncbi:MAG TPA: hypothetical protein VEJ19_01935 [Nitrososphaerales archaeon]|nr:hypothetical protein [Nitrososphaerales archaeon]
MFQVIATIVLGVAAGAIAVLFAASKGYLGHRKTTAPAAPYTSFDTYATTTEQAPEVPAAEAPAVAEPAPSPAPEVTAAPEPAREPAPDPAPAPAMYETVQPAPAPLLYTTPSTPALGAPTLTKPTRTYRRRTAPVRSAAGPKKTLKPKKH